MNNFGFEEYDLKLHRRYPDLTNWNTQQKIQKYERKPEWSCGDPKRAKRAVQRFAQTTGLHGVQYVCPRKKTTWILKLVFRVIFVLCFLMLIGNEIALLQEAFGKESAYINSINKDTKLGKEEDPEYFPEYPAVTVCRKPPYRTDFNQSYMELVEYVFLALGFPMVSFTPHELTMAIQMAQHVNDSSKLDDETLALRDRLIKLENRLQDIESHENFNLTRFIFEHSIGCQEFFLRCIAVLFPMNCCEIFQPVLTSVGVCYTMKDNHELIHINNYSPVERPFIIDLLSPSHPAKGVEQGFNVFLTDPKDTQNVFEEREGQKIVPGFVTTISAHLIKRQRTALHTAWHGGSTRCPTLFGSERFTHKTCFHLMVLKDQKDVCNCTSLLEAFEDNKSERICGPYDQYGCIFQASVKNNLSDIRKKCLEPCIYYRYQSKVSCMSLGGQNISRVEILYDSHQYVYREYRKSTFSSLFSQIGGALGLYLGASIITVVEFITFVSAWFWFKICPARVNNKGKLHIKNALL